MSFIEKVDVYYLNPIYYDSLDSAIDAITAGKAIGALWFHKNYSQALDIRINEPESIDNQTLSESNVKLFLDNTNYLFVNGFVDSMRQTVYKYLSALTANISNTQLEAPIKIEEIIYAKDSKLSDFLLPGYLISFIYLSQVSLSSQLLIQERKDGLFERSLIAGVGHHLVFFSHFFSSCILSLIQISLMLLVSLFIFQVTNFGSYQLIFGLVFAQAANAISVGIIGSCPVFLDIVNRVFFFSPLISRSSHFLSVQRRICSHSGIYFCHVLSALYKWSNISVGISSTMAP